MVALPVLLLLIGSSQANTDPANHWAFQPVKRPQLPKVSTHPVDAFIQQQLQAKQLRQNPEADRRVLIRRLSFDLTGLPPSPEQVEAFVRSTDPQAYEKLVAELLGSPRYGERWARHWLDVARYADNKGYVFFEDKNYPWAWTYRDYVIQAFNEDRPFNQFILEQLAADQLKLGDEKRLAALGFLTVGGRFMGNIHDIIDDRIDTVTRGLLGLTVSCSRCHDHKYDPIPQADYYSLYGVFRSSLEPLVPPIHTPAVNTLPNRMQAVFLQKAETELAGFVKRKHAELVRQARLQAADYLHAAHLARLVPPADDFMLIADQGDLNPAMISRWRSFLERTRKEKLPAWQHWHRCSRSENVALEQVQPSDPPLIQLLFKNPATTMQEVAKRYALAIQLSQFFKAHLLGGTEEHEQLLSAIQGPNSAAEAPLLLDWGFLSLFPDRGTQAQYTALIKQVERFAAIGPPRSMMLIDAPAPHDPRVFQRGNPNRLGEPIPRQFLEALDPHRQPFKNGSGRLELAQAIASEKNPLTARVLVNRVWMHHFGRGLVATPGDFGTRGEAPTHPELLDWLAADFMANGWSLKHLHKLILTSTTYKQSSADNLEAQKADPENRLLARQNRRRLEFEPLHDAMLQVSGKLNHKLGGPPVPLFAGHTRRAVYGYIDRLEFPSLLATFDVPNPAASSSERLSTTVSPQALYLMNGPFTRDAARAWLNTPKVRATTSTPDKCNQLYLAAFGRVPTPAEANLLNQYLGEKPTPDRWLDLAQGLLLTNEFTFVD